MVRAQVSSISRSSRAICCLHHGTISTRSPHSRAPLSIHLPRRGGPRSRAAGQRPRPGRKPEGSRWKGAPWFECGVGRCRIGTVCVGGWGPVGGREWVGVSRCMGGARGWGGSWSRSAWAKAGPAGAAKDGFNQPPHVSSGDGLFAPGVTTDRTREPHDAARGAAADSCRSSRLADGQQPTKPAAKIICISTVCPKTRGDSSDGASKTRMLASSLLIYSGPFDRSSGASRPLLRLRNPLSFGDVSVHVDPSTREKKSTALVAPRTSNPSE